MKFILVLAACIAAAYGCGEENIAPRPTTKPPTPKEMYSVSQSVNGVFQMAKGRYTFTWEQAKAACATKGATLATSAQMTAAYNAGMDYCACGWNSDRVARFPIRKPRKGCSSIAGIMTCGWQKTWNAFCYKTPPVKYSVGHAIRGVFHVNGGKRYVFTFAKAAEACKANGAVLASKAQLQAAYEAGYDRCDCGWTSNHVASFPIRKPRSGCFRTRPPGLRDCLWSSGGWDAYCYKKPKVSVYAANAIKGVFHMNGGRRYVLSYAAAVAKCKSAGAVVASRAQLQAAYQAGYDRCDCGWNSDRVARFPIRKPRSGCFRTRPPGLRDCRWSSGGWDVYCYIK